MEAEERIGVLAVDTTAARRRRTNQAVVVLDAAHVRIRPQRVDLPIVLVDLEVLELQQKELEMNGESLVTARDEPSRGWPRRRTIMSCASEHGVLLVRYFVFQSERLAVYVHHLMTSDEDRALHDHPWSFVTFLMSSGYYEHTPTGRHWRRRFSVLYRPATWQHRLELVKPTWTLVFRFRRVRVWGFITKGGWMDWRTYGREFCD